MKKLSIYSSLFAAITMAPIAMATTVLPMPNGIEAKLENGTEKEKRAYDHLKSVLEKHDTSPYLFTKNIRFKQYEIPHSHPVLTMSTNMVGKDNHALSTFLHEQLHWLTENNKKDEVAAIEALKKIYPEVPVGNRQGARDEYSTYMHIIVCMLEYDATSALIGERAARETLEKKRFYQWIYKEVLNNTDAIKSIMRENNLTLKDHTPVKALVSN